MSRIQEKRLAFKPFEYPWAYDIWKKHEQSHWLASEVPLFEDVKDWKNRLTPEEKAFLTQIFRFFTQSDLDVSEGYVDYLVQFEKPEIRMMLLGFGARESIHIDAYSHLIETIGMPEETYTEFLEYESMVEKHNFFLEHLGDDTIMPIKIAAISAFTEGLALFSSFIMLLNFPRHGKMKGMGQIVSWSMVDEAVTPDTEVLLSTGEWRRIDTISLHDKIYEYNMNTGISSFVFPNKIQKVERDTTYIFEGENYYQEVSPNHRMIIDINGETSESTAERLYNEEITDFSYIASGKKDGTLHHLTEKQKELTILSAQGEIDLDWVTDLYEVISATWCEEFLSLFQNKMLSKKNLDILKTVCNFANKKVNMINNKLSFEEIDNLYVKDVSILKKEHGELVYLFCLGVPGKAFFIRKNGVISVTGNTIHCEGMIRLFREFVEENIEIWNDDTKGKIYTIAEKMVELEDSFVDLAFNVGEQENLKKEDVKKYIRYIADRRLISMGLKGIFKVKTNPLPWVEEMMNAPIHTNFFENRSTDYAKGSLQGDWKDVWA